MTREEEQLRSVLSEVRGATKDLQRAVRDAREAEKSLRDAVREEVDGRIDAEVAAGLERYRLTIKEAMNQAVAKVNREFERLQNIVMYGGQRKTGESIGDLIERAYTRHLDGCPAPSAPCTCSGLMRKGPDTHGG